MKKILVDIRQENEEIKEYFKGKDLVSVDDLLNAIDDLIYENNRLEEKLDNELDAWEPDDYKIMRDMNGEL